MTDMPATNARRANTTPATGPLFEERQRMSEPLVIVIMRSVIVIMLGVAAYILLAQFVLTQLPVGDPMTNGGAIGLSLIFVGTAALIWALGAIIQLRTRVDSAGAFINFFPIYSKRIPLDRIQSWEVRTYHPIREYGGWGIRLSLTLNHWCYTISGHRGVMLTLTGGKRILVGSQRPEAFAAALEQAKGGAGV